MIGFHFKPEAPSNSINPYRNNFIFHAKYTRLTIIVGLRYDLVEMELVDF